MSVGSLRVRAAWLALALVALCTNGSACSDAQQPPQPASFDRPTDVDFVCVKERGDGTGLRDVVQLRECNYNVLPSDRALHALVTQSARGEVAAVNLTTERILDNRRDIPGYTFVRTGELPIAIEVSYNHPEHTYVASYGSRDVRVMSTRAVVGLSSEESDLQTVSLTIDAADGGTFGGTPSDMVLLPGERVLLVTLSDVGKVARLPLDESGMIEEDGITFIDLPVVSPAAPVAVPVDEPYAKYCGGYQPPPMPPVKERPAPPPASSARPIAIALDRTCRDNGGCRQGRVLIADEALPVLHVLDIESLRAGEDPLLAPIATGVPTRDVVVTPSVPDRFLASGSTDSTYFVYAIDAIDGSVMVLQDDQLLAINRDPGGYADRVPLESRSGIAAPLALALEVITPDFSSNEDQGYEQWASAYEPGSTVASPRLACTDGSHTEITPRRLRGVFLSVAMADGTVRVVDVHDRDLRRCRDCDSAPMNDAEVEKPVKAPSAPIVVRHHPRLATDPIAQNETDRDELRPDVNTSVAVRTGVFSIRNNGSVASPLSPTFGCFECAAGFEQALPDPDDQRVAEEEERLARGRADGGGADEDAGASDAGVDGFENICKQALVCGSSDPWAAPTTYSVSYEAPLPNTSGGDGELVSANDARNVTGLLEVHSGIAFCDRGVLGRDDIGGARSEAACTDAPELAGDQLVIVSEPLADAALAKLGRNASERELCARVRTELEENDRAVLGLQIIAAFEDRVAVRSQLDAPFDEGQLKLAWREWSDEADGRTPSLLSCLGDGRVRFYVRSTGGFLVHTGREGFVHNVIANRNGRCVVDQMSGPERSRRTWTGCEYKDDRIQFQLEPYGTQETDPEPGDGYGVVAQFGLGTTSSQLIMNATQIGFGVSTLVPSRLRYSPSDERLYLVDTYQGGLIPIDLDPFTDTPITSFY